MSKFIRLRATATKLIKNNGAMYDFKREVPDVVDPIEGTTPGVPLETNLPAVILPPKKQGAAGQAFADVYKGEDGIVNLSKVNDILFSSEGSEWIPTSEDKILYQGEWWTLKGVTPVIPDGQTHVLHKGIIRRV